MTPHKNAMTYWDEIACQRPEHGRHHSMPVEIDLAKHLPHSDCPDPYTLWIWDPAVHPVDGGPYCPAHDAVSATIWDYGIWEPRETAVALWAFRHATPGQEFYDFGAQLGWYSVLAELCGLRVWAYEADERNANMLEENLVSAFEASTEFGEEAEERWTIFRDRIGPGGQVLTSAMNAALVKIDIEGAEEHAIRILRPAIEAGKVDRILMEISPVFAPYYGDLVAKLIDMGYEALVIPTAEQVAEHPSFDGSRASLRPWSLSGSGRRSAAYMDQIRAEVNSWHQKDVLFVREGVE